MARVGYIGDEVSAAGYRLAGARTYVPAGGGELEALTRACAESEVVLLNAGCAARLSTGVLDPLLRRTAPLLLVVPDGKVPSDGLHAQIKRRIGF